MVIVLIVPLSLAAAVAVVEALAVPLIALDLVLVGIVVGDALAVVETHCSPVLLAAVDAAVKSTPVMLSEVRLGDDLGGNALALMCGSLHDTEIALEICADRAGEHLKARTLLPRLDPDLRGLLDKTTHFEHCANYEPIGAEFPEEVACSWDA